MAADTLVWSPCAPSMSQFTKILRTLQHPAPWRACEEDIGTIVDANGEPVATVDVNGLRSDEDVFELAIWIATVVNTCAGFTAAPAKTEH